MTFISNSSSIPVSPDFISHDSPLTFSWRWIPVFTSHHPFFPCSLVTSLLQENIILQAVSSVIPYYLCSCTLATATWFLSPEKHKTWLIFNQSRTEKHTVSFLCSRVSLFLHLTASFSLSLLWGSKTHRKAQMCFHRMIQSEESLRHTLRCRTLLEADVRLYFHRTYV